jgi:hypothetical protein
MERGNKRSVRIDDELTRETESLIQSGQTETHTREALIKEGLLPDEQPNAGPPSAPRPGQPTDGDVEQRSRLAQALEPHLFPADGARLAEWARQRDLTGWIIELLDRLPAEETFPNPEAVWERSGGVREHR